MPDSHGGAERPRRGRGHPVLIDDIYEAAFDAAHCGTMLERLAELVGADSAFIAWHDTRKSAHFRAHWGDDPHWQQRYVEEFVHHDILRPVLAAQPEGMLGTVAEKLDDPDIRASYFYTGYIAPQGIVDNMACNLIKQPTVHGIVAFMRRAPRPRFGSEEVAAMRPLVPHLRRAVLIQSQLIAAANVAEAHRQIAQSSRAHIVLLSRTLDVADADPRVAAMLGLRVGQPLRASTHGRALATAVADGQPLVVTLVDDDGTMQHLLCEPQALGNDPFGDLALPDRPAHALHVSEVERPHAIAYDAIATLYQLTPTEQRVLRAMLDHGDAAGLSAALGMGRATVRTHLHNVYAKTGTAGFSALCNLAHRFSRAVLPRGDDLNR